MTVQSCKATKINTWKNNRYVIAIRIAQNAFASLHHAVHERVNYLSIKSVTIFYLLYDETHYRLAYRATFSEPQCSWSFMENSAKRASNNSSPLQRRFSVPVGGLFSSWMTSQLLRTIAHCRHRPTRLSLSEGVFEEFLVIKLILMFSAADHDYLVYLVRACSRYFKAFNLCICKTKRICPKVFAKII